MTDNGLIGGKSEKIRFALSIVVFIALGMALGPWFLICAFPFGAGLGWQIPMDGDQ